MFDIRVWLDKEGVKYEEVNKDNISWECPFCRKAKGHFTVSITKKQVFNCYHCSMSGDYVELIMKMKGVSYKDAYDIVNDFFLEISGFDNKETKHDKPHQITLPSRSSWTARTRKYLEDRGWSRAEIEEYGFYPTSEWPYKGRIVLPAFEDGLPVFFQARTTTNKRPKYLSPKGSGKSNWLWNIDSLEGISVVLTEGIFDAASVKRAGWPSVAVFGKTVSQVQIDKLRNRGIREVFLFFDPDTVFLNLVRGFHMDILGMRLAKNFPKIWFVKADGGDPGGMTPEQVNMALQNPFESYYELMVRSA